ncbi:MAG TPA: IS91 family transposase [Ignavibacteria bacterium]|nr:IS91 family transposase [Ignavibacteria bacterium]
MENKRQKIEIADIFRDNAESFIKKHVLCVEQRKAFKAITQCRTTVIGGNTQECDNCGHIRQSYNSCRNRHCPKCQYIKQQKWVDKLASNLPPTKCFHLVFTVPHCLNKLFYINQAVAYSLLFKAAGKSLQQTASNPDFLGAEVGAVGILHTWGQNLSYHPHIHMIVPAGGLDEDMGQWIVSKRKFFVPIKAISKVFRGILCSLLANAIAKEEMLLPDNANKFKQLQDQAYKKNWVVYCEKAISNAQSLIKYLGNYTHRVAISNHRIIDYKNGKVKFTYKNNRKSGIKESIELSAEEFIRRFLQHVLPKRFCKIRYFGYLALCNMKTKLSSCFELISKTSFLPILEGVSALEVIRITLKKDIFSCPECKTGKMLIKKMSVP